MLVEEGVCYAQCVLLAELLAFTVLHFVTPKPDLPAAPGIS